MKSVRRLLPIMVIGLICLCSCTAPPPMAHLIPEFWLLGFIIVILILLIIGFLLVWKVATHAPRNSDSLQHHELQDIYRKIKILEEKINRLEKNRED